LGETEHPALAPVVKPAAEAETEPCARPACCCSASGTACLDDLHSRWGFLLGAHPTSRAGLLSYTHDAVIAAYLGISGADVAAGLAQREAQCDGHPNGHFFYVQGTAHCMLRNPKAHSQNGVTAFEWIVQMAQDDVGWTSIAP
jgi:hypothetical protein